MKNYFEITLIENPEIGIYELWSKLYTQLHLAFVEQKNQQSNTIGVSFPEYQYKPKKGGYLGSKLRIFGSNEAVLRQLNLPKWLAHLMNYIHCSDIREVPNNRIKKYAQFRRQRIKGSTKNLARRRAKRHGVSIDEAMKHYTNKTVTSDLPYIRLNSLTTGQIFQLYIEKREHSELIQDGFGTYGLSSSSTVPEF